MMEWGDYGLKSGEDVLEALHKTRTRAHDMHEVMAAAGPRFTGLMADALDIVLAQLRLADAMRAAVDAVEPDALHPARIAADAYDEARRTSARQAVWTEMDLLDIRAALGLLPTVGHDVVLGRIEALRAAARATAKDKP